MRRKRVSYSVDEDIFRGDTSIKKIVKDNNNNSPPSLSFTNTTSSISTSKMETSLTPRGRLLQLEAYGEMLQIDPFQNLDVYYKIGMEMCGKADEFYKKGDFENAYVLRLKFKDLVTIKMKRHPCYEYKSINNKSRMYLKLREGEKQIKILKAELLKAYSKAYEYHMLLDRKDCTSKEVTRKLSFSSKSLNGAAMSTRFLCGAADEDYITSKSLRTVEVPRKLPTMFQIMVQLETRNDIQCWGLIVGNLQDDKYVVSHLVVPDQTVARNDCFETIFESASEMDAYLKTNNLLALGWIHIHRYEPSIYMSSMDLHTHYKLQSQIAESVAIICSPRNCRIGTYKITFDFGMDFIRHCQHLHGFHVHHAEFPLYAAAKHVVYVHDAPLQVVDLRVTRNGLKIPPLPFYI